MAMPCGKNPVGTVAGEVGFRRPVAVSMVNIETVDWLVALETRFAT